MIANPSYQHTLPNGFTLLAEQLDHVRSATAYFLIRGGFVFDPTGSEGTATLLAEMLFRGAGERNSIELANELDNLGTDRTESPGAFNLVLSVGTLARSLTDVLGYYADVIRRPHLPPDQLASSRDLLMLDLMGLEDSPQEKVILELKKRFYPAPFNRSRYGTESGLANVTAESLRSHYANHFQPDGVILSVAGKFDWPELVARVEELFGDWAGSAPPLPTPAPHTPQSEHILKETQQTQIALAYPSVQLSDPQYYAARGAVSVLSGGMSSRLFTEVREKRGLCYSVYATHDALKQAGAVICYAGTRAEKAAETLAVLKQELRQLRHGITSEELDRVKVGLKSALIMQQESTGARAGSQAVDWFQLGRIRTLEEIRDAVESLNEKAILDYLEQYPLENPTVVTMGPAPLE